MNLYKNFEDKWVLSQYTRLTNNDTHCLFKPNSREGKSALLIIRVCIRMMIISFFLTGVLFNYFSVFSALSAWAFFMFWYFKVIIESRMSNGYPYMEPSDPLALVIVAIPTFIAVVVLIWIMS